MRLLTPRVCLCARDARARRARVHQACNNRERNKGLYVADQNLNNNDATRTRQNPNGARSGLECPGAQACVRGEHRPHSWQRARSPIVRHASHGVCVFAQPAEERDYYPYWAPSPWKDLMVMTNNLELCPFYQQNSQNVQAKGYCTGSTENNRNDIHARLHDDCVDLHRLTCTPLDLPRLHLSCHGHGRRCVRAPLAEPNNQPACVASQGTWHIVEPFNIPPPECVTAPVTRDNHLGNDRTGNEVFANISIPANAGGVGNDAAQACSLRLRYNITTADSARHLPRLE